MLIGMLLNISFFMLWAYYAFSFLENGYGIISSTLLSFLVVFFIFFSLGVFLGLAARYLGFKDKLDKHFKPEPEPNKTEKVNINFTVIQSSPEIACVFKDMKFPKWVKISTYPYELFFKEAVHVDKSGIYRLHEPLKPNHVIIPPGAIYGPEETV